MSFMKNEILIPLSIQNYLPWFQRSVNFSNMLKTESNGYKLRVVRSYKHFVIIDRAGKSWR